MAGSASTTVGASASSPQDENFVRRLIEAVKGQPCLYNPNHEHYGNKHSSAQYRCRVWQKLCQDLGFTEDAHALQMQWKRIRDRYVRERRKRRSANTNENLSHQDGAVSRERHPSGGSTCSTSSGSTNSAASRHYEMMRNEKVISGENREQSSREKGQRGHQTFKKVRE
ncbi:unnamed protein product [Toxocara canis]|uniref:MADF domain-containing protein n=1 Tax=Toxocara canis TaxID=6265 RepID=A0A183U1Q7_TOXCA|nr:unnamed protein product [Toxocara canis]